MRIVSYFGEVVCQAKKKPPLILTGPHILSEELTSYFPFNHIFKVCRVYTMHKSSRSPADLNCYLSCRPVCHMR